MKVALATLGVMVGAACVKVAPIPCRWQCLRVPSMRAPLAVS